ncbi:MAG: hypothetical protein HY537_18110 [Deltaproteobacteria bacterium]|nr:hypothetical protein [Deltaproteobacteria bacterium]
MEGDASAGSFAFEPGSYACRFNNQSLTLTAKEPNNKIEFTVRIENDGTTLALEAKTSGQTVTYSFERLVWPTKRNKPTDPFATGTPQNLDELQGMELKFVKKVSATSDLSVVYWAGRIVTTTPVGSFCIIHFNKPPKNIKIGQPHRVTENPKMDADEDGKLFVQFELETDINALECSLVNVKPDAKNILQAMRRIFGNHLTLSLPTPVR